MAESKALIDLNAGLGAVDNVLSFAKSGVGKPSLKENSLFVASVALSYAVWENYVEEVAIEVTDFLAAKIKEGSVPESVREWIMKGNPSAWDLAVHPGWRELWRTAVRARAKGLASDQQDLGMNTANAKNVIALFERVGVAPFSAVPKKDQDKLDKLVKERGQIVHTGKAPSGFYKKNATDWRTFVEALGTKVDACLSEGTKKLVGSAPW